MANQTEITGISLGYWTFLCVDDEESIALFLKG